MAASGAGGAERRMLELLAGWRQREPAEQGYGSGNLVNLLRLLRGDLRGLDFSRLALRQAYLAQVDAQDARLVDAHLAETVLAEAFDFPGAVALSGDGAFLAAGTSTGEVWLWRVADRTPLWTVQGHTGPIRGMALSVDGRLLASGGGDGTVRLWEAGSGRLLATLVGHIGGVSSLALSVDGRLWPVAVGKGRCDCGMPAAGDPSRRSRATPAGFAARRLPPTVGCWPAVARKGRCGCGRRAAGGCLRTLRPERRYERLDITGLTGITAAQRAALLALGVIEDAAAERL